MLWGEDKKRIADLENKLNKIEKAVNDEHVIHRNFRWATADQAERLKYRISDIFDTLERRIKKLEASTIPSVADEIKRLNADRDAIDKQLKGLQDLVGPTTDKEKYGTNFTPRDWDKAASDVDPAAYITAATYITSVLSDVESCSSADSSSSCD